MMASATTEATIRNQIGQPAASMSANKPRVPGSSCRIGSHFIFPMNFQQPYFQGMLQDFLASPARQEFFPRLARSCGQ
jgi:hypothetical protein